MLSVLSSNPNPFTHKIPIDSSRLLESTVGSSLCLHPRTSADVRCWTASSSHGRRNIEKGSDVSEDPSAVMEYLFPWSTTARISLVSYSWPSQRDRQGWYIFGEKKIMRLLVSLIGTWEAERDFFAIFHSLSPKRTYKSSTRSWNHLPLAYATSSFLMDCILCLDVWPAFSGSCGVRFCRRKAKMNYCEGIRRGLGDEGQVYFLWNSFVPVFLWNRVMKEWDVFRGENRQHFCYQESKEPASTGH